MAIRVRVRNFQSLKDVTLTIDGLTIITGKNNSGKTAFLRAIQGAFQNTKGDGFVRHGEGKCTVELDFGDGLTLKWEKGPKIRPTYVINGGTPIHPGLKVPDEIRIFGVGPVTAGGREVWPQIAPQFKGQVFLLDEPGSVLAEAVANVDRVGRLNRSLSGSEKDLRSVTAELKVRRTDVERYQEALDQFQDLDGVLAEVEVIEETVRQTVRLLKALQGLITLQDKLQNARGVVQALQGVETLDIPDCTEAGTLLGEVLPLESLHERLQKAYDFVQSLQGVESIVIPQRSIAESLLGEMQPLEGLRDKWIKSSAVVEHLKGVELLEVSADAVPADKCLKAIKQLHRWETKVSKARVTVGALERTLLEKEGELEELTGQIQGALGDLGECPTCGVLVEGSHAH